MKILGWRLIKEPLVHFVVAGAAVFWVLSGRPPDLGERRIVVDEAVAGALVRRYYDSFRRMPSKDEIDGLISDWVADQVYYREALRLGLDQGDEVVVRRMRRKLESMAVADAETAEPSDAELQALIDKDPAHYSEDPRTSFEQVYLGADTPQSRARADLQLAQLRGGKPVNGVPAPLPAQLGKASAADISGQFGDEFTLSLRRLPVGQWQGPVASGLGLHLVRITARDAPSPPSLANIRQRVTNDWRAAAIQRAQAQAYGDMLKGYDVVIVPVK
ncbi:MAG: peptidylprolyl isomerase [Novosphingobium sp.]|uniref:peptidylprolyl isomerase n=1 Tax=Novosphingobium sp. TaxID=1874826 RepID=UPI0032BB77B1